MSGGGRAGKPAPRGGGLLILLCALSPAWAAETAAPPAIPLAPWQVLAGQGEISQPPGGPMVAKLTQGNELRVASAPFPVQGDTIYWLTLRLKRQPDLRVYAHIQEVQDGQPGVDHSLFFWPGYALPPPEFLGLGSYFAPGPTATAARLVVVIWPGENRKAGEVAVQSLAIAPVGKVTYPATDSANFLVNGACEEADAQGIELYWTRWGGAPEGRIAPGQGRNRTAAMALSGNYMLSQANFLPLPGRRYRLGGWFKGTGTVSF